MDAMTHCIEAYTNKHSHPIIDNIVIERFWRSLKYEDVYLNDYTNKKEAQKGINEYIEKYNSRRLHSAIGYKTPDEVYFNQGLKKAA